MAITNFPEITKVLESAGRLMADSIGATAVQKGRYETGRMARSFSPGPVTEQDGKIKLTIETSVEYSLYQDAGVNGIRNNVGSTYSFKDKMPPWAPRTTLSFAAAKSIYENGIQPGNFIQPGVQVVLDKFVAPQLENAGVTDIENIIVKDIETKFIKVK